MMAPPTLTTVLSKLSYTYIEWYYFGGSHMSLGVGGLLGWRMTILSRAAGGPWWHRRRGSRRRYSGQSCPGRSALWKNTMNYSRWMGIKSYAELCTRIMTTPYNPVYPHFICQTTYEHVWLCFKYFGCCAVCVLPPDCCLLCQFEN